MLRAPAARLRWPRRVPWSAIQPQRVSRSYCRAQARAVTTGICGLGLRCSRLAGRSGEGPCRSWSTARHQQTHPATEGGESAGGDRSRKDSRSTPFAAAEEALRQLPAAARPQDAAFCGRKWPWEAPARRGEWARAAPAADRATGLPRPSAGLPALEPCGSADGTCGAQDARAGASCCSTRQVSRSYCRTQARAVTTGICGLDARRSGLAGRSGEGPCRS